LGEGVHKDIVTRELKGWYPGQDRKGPLEVTLTGLCQLRELKEKGDLRWGGSCVH